MSTITEYLELTDTFEGRPHRIRLEEGVLILGEGYEADGYTVTIDLFDGWTPGDSPEDMGWSEHCVPEAFMASRNAEDVRAWVSPDGNTVVAVYAARDEHGLKEEWVEVWSRR